ncbi:hypothetical protein K435DRAFT_789283 [Dendrothele bispora CBS 962.96]|uniref:Uncharacterized protein n=1 Tax=Dendrothele bispora (strain CBS 962.96) TaxID=1314807 RepID=A0A4S8MV18_DENBC|nr:hypothetical protein K435DRAFT_789283 [Dendrothele bispora CBS 962.96]
MYDIDGTHIGKNGEVVNEEKEFRVVKKMNHQDFTPEAIQLVVIHGVAVPPPLNNQAVENNLFYEWFQNVINYACKVRQNQQPATAPTCSYCDKHWVGKELSKKLTTEECIVHDEDNAAAEVTTPVIEELQKLNIPRLVSRYVNPGSGFKLTIDEMEYNFFNFEQAPPEVDLTQGYSVWSHTDLCYTPWAFNITVGRVKADTLTAKKRIPIPEQGGANFVVVDLKVVVMNAPATIFAFNPEQLHGTTVTGDTVNYNMTFAFSQKVADALDKLAANGDDAFFRAK